MKNIKNFESFKKVIISEGKDFYTQPKLDNIDKLKDNLKKYGTFKIKKFGDKDLVLFDLTKSKSGKTITVSFVFKEELESEKFHKSNKGIVINVKDGEYKYEYNIDEKTEKAILKFIKDNS